MRKGKVCSLRPGDAAARPGVFLELRDGAVRARRGLYASRAGMRMLAAPPLKGGVKGFACFCKHVADAQGVRTLRAGEMEFFLSPSAACGKLQRVRLEAGEVRPLRVEFHGMRPVSRHPRLFPEAPGCYPGERLRAGATRGGGFVGSECGYAGSEEAWRDGGTCPKGSDKVRAVADAACAILGLAVQCDRFALPSWRTYAAVDGFTADGRPRTYANQRAFFFRAFARKKRRPHTHLEHFRF